MNSKKNKKRIKVLPLERSIINMQEERALTREHLTDEYKEEIRNEIRRALIYFGEWDEKRMETTIDSSLFNLWIDLAAIEEKHIIVEDEELRGYTISVGMAGEDLPDIERNGIMCTHEQLYDVELFINKDGFQYLLYSFECYQPLRSTNYDDIEVVNRTYKKVKLEDLNKDAFEYNIEM
jgi:hypothetical protein